MHHLDAEGEQYDPKIPVGGMIEVPAAALDAAAFADVVRDGSRQRNGMPAYRHLNDEQLLKIRHYVRGEAQRALQTAGGE